jgi:hypothetical protein
MGMAPLDDRLPAVMPMTPTFLDKAAVGTDQQEQQAKHLLHLILTVKDRPGAITGWVEQLTGHA